MLLIPAGVIYAGYSVLAFGLSQIMGENWGFFPMIWPHPNYTPPPSDSSTSSSSSTRTPKATAGPTGQVPAVHNGGSGVPNPKQTVPASRRPGQTR